MKIIDVANAIKRMEGWFPPCPKYPSGSISFQNNNPGNIRPPGEGRALRYPEGSIIPGVGGFCRYATPDDGFSDIVTLIQRRQAQFPNWTILQFFDDPIHGYAPAADHNDPTAYANFIAAVCGGPVTTALKDLT